MSVAQARLAYEAVEEHLGQALQLIQGMPAGAERDRQELRVQDRLALFLIERRAGLGDGDDIVGLPPDRRTGRVAR